jgi:hypothetical protein
MKKVVKKPVAKAPVKKTVAKKPMMKSGGAKKSLPKAQTGTQTGKNVQQMTDAEKKAYAEAWDKSQNKESIRAGEKAYLANKDGRVSMVDYAGRNQPFYTKTIDTTGLSKGVKNFELERDIDRGKGYNPSYTPITKTAALKTINKWKNETNKQKVEDNKQKVEANRQKVYANANKVAVNAAKYEKNGGATKSTYKKGGAVKITAKKVMVKSKKK